MLAAAPESRCGAVVGNVGAEKPISAQGPLASLRETGEAPVATWALVAACAPPLAGRTKASAAAWAAVALTNSDGWASFGWATYSVAGVSSSEVAKWEPMGLIFSAEFATH